MDIGRARATPHRGCDMLSGMRAGVFISLMIADCRPCIAREFSASALDPWGREHSAPRAPDACLAI